MAAGLGEIWEEMEFWPNLIVRYVDPDGSLGVRKYHASKEDPTRPVTVYEWYQAALDLLPNLRRAAQTNPKYKNTKYPNYYMMRDMGTWLEEDNVYHVHEKPMKKKDGTPYSEDEIEVDEFGTVWTEDKEFGKKSVGVIVDGKAKKGFKTLSRKIEIYSQWLTKWKWPEYALPFYPRNKEERKKYIHLVTQVHHDYIDPNKNELALNTIYRLVYMIHTRSSNSKHLMEMSQNHNPIWIYTEDAKRMGIKRGDKVKVRIVDTVSGLESGYFVAVAVPTEATRPGVAACSHHAGRWTLKNAVEIPGYKHKLPVMTIGAPTYEMTMDGKVGTMKPKKGIDAKTKDLKDSWQFKEFNKDLDNIWWDGLSGSWQNAVAPAHPDPVAGNHAWHQKIIIEKAGPEDKIGDIWVNYENNFKTYKAWRDKLTRPLDHTDTLRRPTHIKRSGSKVSLKGYTVSLKP